MFRSTAATNTASMACPGVDLVGKQMTRFLVVPADGRVGPMP